MTPTSCATRSLCEWLKLTLVTLLTLSLLTPHTRSPHSVFPPRQCRRLRHHHHHHHLRLLLALAKNVAVLQSWFSMPQP